jgi:SulP family sulfate permease
MGSSAGGRAASPPPVPSRAFVPASILALRGYTPRTFLSDLVAGVTVGLVALPLAMAFAISSGVAPESGIYCAVIAGFLVSALGGSRLQIAGPTGAFVVVVSGIVAKHGIDGLFMCTLMAGVALVALGLTGLGTAVKYIPRSVVIGFTNGIAVLIFLSQLKDVLGLPLENVPVDFVPRVTTIAENLGTTHVPSLALAVGTVLLILLWPRRAARRVPASILALVAGTALVSWTGLDVATIGTRFGGIPDGLPPVRLPTFDWASIGSLIRPATTIALLAAI